MDWTQLLSCLDEWPLVAAEPSWRLRAKTAGLVTPAPVGYYLNPYTEALALFSYDAVSLAAAKEAAAEIDLAPRDAPLTDTDLRYGPWIKIAYSQALRSAGEALNFFPGQYPGTGIPNSPSPVAAMLTTGLLGAGLGYGAGRLAKRFLPEGYGDNLGRGGAILGAILGAAPGAAWAAANRATGRSLFDPSPLDEPAGSPPQMASHWQDGANMTAEPMRSLSPDQLRQYLNAIPLSNRFKHSCDAYVKEAFGPTFGSAVSPSHHSPVDVHIDAVGRTLWDLGASPALTGTTMGALYAARQLPGGSHDPRVVTGAQLGQLAENAAGDFTTWLLAGAAINAVVGTPYSAPVIGLGNAALGIIGAVIPKLFGG